MQDSTPAQEYRSGDYVIAAATRRLRRGDSEIELEAKVFDLILLLVGHHERALGKQEIIAALWGHRPITDAALSQLIYKARRAFDDDGERQAVIRTIYGRGLQWVAPLEVSTPVSEPAEPESVPSEATTATTPARRRHRWLWPAAAMLLVAGLLLTWRMLPTTTAFAAPTPPRLALLPIENATGDAAQDWAQRGLPGLLGSLLDGTRGIDVIDPLRTARIWGYTPAKGKSRAEHTRSLANADVLVGGRLRKLADLYELNLHVDPGGNRHATDITVTGADPGALAVAAVPRLRRALKLESAVPIPLGAGPQDAYLAQTFARGMDAAMHGKWSDARPHFALVAKGEPDFLPARYRLGQAQARTDQQNEAQATMRRLLADAEKRDDPETAANTLEELAFQATLRHAYPEAIALIKQAQPFAERARIPDIQAWLAIDSAKAMALLKQSDGATSHLQTARRLIESHRLRALQPDLHNAAVFVATSRNDFKAAEAAARAGLAANQAIGNERGSMASVFNIARAMDNQGRRVEAMPFWAQAWRWGWAQQDYQMQSLAGYSLARGLADAGLDELGEKVGATVLATARKQGDRNMQSLALQLRAGAQWNRGDSASALRSCREAVALNDATSDPVGMLGAWTAEAYVALAAEPASLAAIVQRVDTLVARQPDPTGYRFQQQLLHALRAAATGDATAARSELDKAAKLAGGNSETADVQQTALNIALANGDAGIAAMALRDLDIDHANDAGLLQLAARWAARQNDANLAQRVAQRQASLRQDALHVLQGVDFDAVPVAPEDADA